MVLLTKYYYIVAVVKGRRFLSGPYMTRDEARKVAWKKLQGVVWEIIESPYRDMNRVMRTLRHKIWEKTNDLEEATNRMKHKI